MSNETEKTLSGSSTVTLIAPNLSEEQANNLSHWLANGLTWAFPWMEHTLSVTTGRRHTKT